MTAVLALLLVNVVLGAWDTLWYHEYRARLTGRLDTTRTELRLHAARDAVYVVLYGFLAFCEPAGLIVAVVMAGLGLEIVITLIDFVVEDRDRPAIGGMAAGERVLHSLMAIVYGAMLAELIPALLAASAAPTGVRWHDAPLWMSVAAVLSAAGIAVSGVRDVMALRGFDPVWSPTRAVVGSDRRLACAATLEPCRFPRPSTRSSRSTTGSVRSPSGTFATRRSTT